ncbi:MAG: hypothetical protein OCC49_12990 [Fibrobacterales bacterium]
MTVMRGSIVHVCTVLITLSLFHCAESFPVVAAVPDSSDASTSSADEISSSENVIAQDLEHTIERMVQLFDQLDTFEHVYRENFATDTSMSLEKEALLLQIKSTIDSLDVYKDKAWLNSDFLNGISINGVTRIDVEERVHFVSSYVSVIKSYEYKLPKSEGEDVFEKSDFDVDPNTAPAVDGNYYPIFEAGQSKVVYANEDEVSWINIMVTELNDDMLEMSVLKPFSNARLSFTNDPSSENLKQSGNRWAYGIEFEPTENFNGLDTSIIQISDGELNDTLQLIFDIAPQNDNPILKGIANINNVHTEGDTLIASLVSGDCIDPNDSGTPPELIYAWYRDVDNIKNNGNEERTDDFKDQIVLQESDTAYYYYVVAICMDGESFILSERDTSRYTDKVLLNDYAPTFVDGDRKYIEGYEDAVHTFKIAAVDDKDSIDWWPVNSESSHGKVVVKKDKGNIAQFEYEPNPNYYGEDEFEIVAKGGKRSDTVTVIVETYSVNDAPQVVFTKKSPDGVVVENEALTIEASCSDVDGKNDIAQLSYKWYSEAHNSGYNGDEVGKDQISSGSEESSLTIDSNMVNAYVYAIVECQDLNGVIAVDTSYYSDYIFEEEKDWADNVLAFDGQKDWIDLGDITPNLNNGITLEAMVYWEGNTGKDNILMLSDESGKNRVSLGRHNQDTLAITIVNDEIYTIGAVKGFINDNQWTHIAVTIESGQPVRVYKNGFLVSESDLGFPNVVHWTKNSIGKGFEDNNEMFKGKIDEIRVWEDVRSAEEIRTSMFSEMTDQVSQLYAAWDFNNVGGAILWNVKSIRQNGILVAMDNSNWLKTMKKIDLKIYSNYSAVLDTMNVTIAENMLFPLSYTPSNGFEFKSWELDQSNGVITDPNQQITYFTGVEDALIQLKCNDVWAPDAPSGIHSESHDDGSFVLKWNKPNDNVGTVGYTIYRDGEWYGETNTEEMYLNVIGSGTYTIDAFDLEGRKSLVSNPLVHFEAEDWLSGLNIVSDTIDAVGLVKSVDDAKVSIRWNGQFFDTGVPAGEYNIAYRIKPLNTGDEFESEVLYKGEKKLSISGQSIDAENGWTYVVSSDSFDFDGDLNSPFFLDFDQSEFMVDWIQMQPINN